MLASEKYKLHHESYKYLFWGNVKSIKNLHSDFDEIWCVSLLPTKFLVNLTLTSRDRGHQTDPTLIPDDLPDVIIPFLSTDVMLVSFKAVRIVYLCKQ